MWIFTLVDLDPRKKVISTKMDLENPLDEGKSAFTWEIPGSGSTYYFIIWHSLKANPKKGEGSPRFTQSFSTSQCAMKCNTHISSKTCQKGLVICPTKEGMKRDVSAIEVSLHSMNVLLDAFVSSSIRIRHYSSRKRHNSLMFCIETTYEVSVEALSSIKPENVAAKKTGPFSEAPLLSYDVYL